MSVSRKQISSAISSGEKVIVASPTGSCNSLHVREVRWRQSGEGPHVAFPGEAEHGFSEGLEVAVEEQMEMRGLRRIRDHVHSGDGAERFGYGVPVRQVAGHTPEARVQALERARRIWPADRRSCPRGGSATRSPRPRRRPGRRHNNPRWTRALCRRTRTPCRRPRRCPRGDARSLRLPPISAPRRGAQRHRCPSPRPPGLRDPRKTGCARRDRAGAAL